MSVQTLYDTSPNEVQSEYDGGVYQLITDDCVIDNIGDEFTLQYSASSLQISFNQGSQAIICGSFFKVISQTSLTLPNNSQIFLCARIDKSKTNLSRGFFVALTQAQIQKQDLNGSGTVHDLLLYEVRTNASGVVSVTDRRNIKGMGSGITVGTLSVGQTSITLSNQRIATNSVLSFYTSIFGVNPETVSVSSGSVTLTFPPQSSNMVVGVGVEGTY